MSAININNLKSLDELCNLLKDCKVQISFLGRREVKDSKNNTIYSIDKIALKAMYLFSNYSIKWGFSEDLRKKIHVIESKIDKFYFDSDEILENRSTVTKIFNWFRELLHLFYNPRKTWESQPSLAEYYSKEQFEKTFHKSTLPTEPDETYRKMDLYLPPDQIQKWYEMLFFC